MARPFLVALAVGLLASAGVCLGHSYEIEYPDVSDSVWVYQLDDLTVTLTLRKGGTVSYTHAGGTFDKGTWTQKGRSVYLETNDRYWECRVLFRGDTGTAEAWNVAGKRWELHWSRRQ